MGSLRVMIKKLAHKRKISSEECNELMSKLDGHDVEVRADERNRVLEEVLDAFKNDWTLESLACHDSKYEILAIIKRQIEQLKEMTE